MKNKFETIQDVKREIIRLDKSMKTAGENYHGFRTAVFLLSSLITGPNVKKLAKFTGYTRKEIQERAVNLREQGVWVGSKVNASEWFDSDGGAVSFWCDSLCADGLLQRGKEPI